MLKEHQKAQEELKNGINTKRVAAEKAVESLTVRSVKELNGGIAQAYLNEQKLDNEARKLQENVTRLTKQAQQWMLVCNNLNSAVKDLGDISTWTRTIQNEVKFVARAVEESYRPRNDENQ